MVFPKRRPSGCARRSASFAAVIPWNAPHQVALVKLYPALLAGCTAILKLAPETALSGQFLGELFAEAGVPEGVVSILVADREVSEHLVSHPGVDKIGFHRVERRRQAHRPHRQRPARPLQPGARR